MRSEIMSVSISGDPIRLFRPLANVLSLTLVSSVTVLRTYG